MAKNKVLTKTRGANDEGSIFRRSSDNRWVGSITTGVMKMVNKLKKLCMDELERKFQKNCLKSVDEFEAILMK